MGGLRVVKVSRNELEVSVIPELGGLIWSIKYGGYELLYHHRDPEPIEHFREGLMPEDFYNVVFFGGWFEVIPNAGYASRYAGASFGLHDEAPYLPWRVEYDEEVDEYSILMIVTLRKYPLKLYRRIRLINSNEVLIRERLINLSNQALKFSWLHHPNFGGDLLSERTVLELPEGTEVEVDKYLNSPSILEPGYRGLFPMVKSKGGEVVDLSRFPRSINTEDLVYVPTVKGNWFRLINEDLGIRLEANWDSSIFRSMWMWRPLNSPNYPWFGRIYATALEPTTSWPATGLAEQVKNGTAYEIQGNGELNTWIKIKVTS
ncbi:aldose 1-epimerase [Caldivirga sp. UBA161]|uniref:aldose 1-epimerase n=1 Tax=Caldivirga sp. UBA161 TaxID=1915569 RepID=UPI0025C687D1|nr:aldose 1-epimerase [Caldivirga sp. UBA161]